MKMNLERSGNKTNEFSDILAIKSGIGYIISIIIINGISALTTPLFSRLLSTNDFGELNNYTSWESLFVLFITLSLEASLICARYDYEEEFDGFVKSIVAFVFCIFLLWIIIIIVFNNWITLITGVSVEYLFLMLAQIVFGRMILLYHQREKLFYRYKNSVYVSLSASISMASLSIVLVLLMNDRLMGRILGMTISEFIIGLGCGIILLKNAQGINTKYWKYAIRVSLPYIPHLLSMTILNSTDRIMIKKICGAEDTAIYSLAYNASLLITMLFMAINDAFVPWLGDRLIEREFETIRKASLRLVCLVLVSAIGILLLAPEVIKIFGGDNYKQSVYVMPPVVFGCCFQYIYTMYVNVEQIKKKTKWMAMASGIAALINVGLNCLFIPKYGYIAAAYTTLFSYFCLFIIHMFVLKKIGFGYTYNNKVLCVLSFVLFVLTVYFEKLLYFKKLRYIVVVLYFVVLGLYIFKHKGKLILLIQQLFGEKK